MKKIIKVWSIFSLLTFFALLSAHGQTSYLTGKVISPTGEPASLVTVELLNKNNKTIASTVTDMDGNYNIKVAHMKYEVLRFQYLGFEVKTLNAHLPNPIIQLLNSRDNINENEPLLESKVGLK
ncbi:MAG: hypothetical protein EAZ07_08965 [Cytophagales bacterium]|nr:MAG: hypothetical protein EAZ07_08965 [Cytophagales bacterium]